MAYTTTHFTLQGLALWLLLSKKNKEYFKAHRWEFILINLFAALPDLDIFFGYHRSYTHSLIIPTFIIFSMIVIEKFSDKSADELMRGFRITRFLKLISIMWLLHIFLDLSWGPSLLFWPIDTNIYDLSIFLRFENMPWLFFPLTLLGIFPNWEIYSLSEGQRLFFINLSQQEREALLGNTLDLYIEQYSIEILLAITWIIIILIPIFKKNRRKTKGERKRFGNILVNIWKRIKRQLTLLGGFLIILGLILGPVIGKEKTMSYEISADYVDTLTFFDPTLGLAFENKPQTTVQIQFQSEIGIVSYNSTIMLTDNSTFSNFFTNFDNITLNYYDGNITYYQLIQLYNDQVNLAIVNSYFVSRIIDTENENSYTLTLNETSEISTVYLITLVDQWNNTESFIYEANISIDYILNRKQALIEGGVLDGIGLLFILFDQTIAFLNNRKRRKNSPS